MKKVVCIIFFVVFVIKFPVSQDVFAITIKNPQSLKVIQTYHEDITGDGFHEVIELKGILLSESSNFFHDIIATITSNNKSWRTHLGSGYDPNLYFIDFTHNGTKEIVFQTTMETESDFTTSKLFSLNNGTLQEMFLPIHTQVKGEFKNNFAVDINISSDSNAKQIDVTNRKSEYIRNGIYNIDGVLIKENLNTLVKPATYQPKLISTSNGFGLKSYQEVYGISQTDLLGTLETLWFYENDNWIILHSEWVPASKEIVP